MERPMDGIKFKLLGESVLALYLESLPTLLFVLGTSVSHYSSPCKPRLLDKEFSVVAFF